MPLSLELLSDELLSSLVEPLELSVVVEVLVDELLSESPLFELPEPSPSELLFWPQPPPMPPCSPPWPPGGGELAGPDWGGTVGLPSSSEEIVSVVSPVLVLIRTV